MMRNLLCVAALCVVAYACGDGTTEPPPYFPEPTPVTVSPATAELVALGATVQLSAQVQDQNGQMMSGATVTWASGANDVATVDATGLVTAIASGSVKIMAISASVSGSAMVTVAQEVSSVTVVPDTATVVEGDTLRIAATATDANGQVVTGAGFVWGSGDTTVAVVDATGLVTGVGAGQVQVAAISVGVTGRAELTVVAPVPTAVVVTPDSVVLTSLGHASLSFAMPVALSEEAEVSSFVFALPVQPDWADALANITLSGPAGTATLDGDSDIRMAILRDPVTGRVRGFLRDVGDPAAGALARAAGGLDVLLSRGIPGASAWRR